MREETRHRVGEAVALESEAPGGRYAVVFEDDGETAYLYGFDEAVEQVNGGPIVDALQIYDVASVADRDSDVRIEVRWGDGRNRVGLFIDGRCHAVLDFDNGRAICRSGFPPASGSFTTSHDWDDELESGL
jgi:hypothetical protein